MRPWRPIRDFVDVYGAAVKEAQDSLVYYAEHGGDLTDLDKMAEQAVGAAWMLLCSSKNMTADDVFFEPIPSDPAAAVGEEGT